MVEEGVGSVRGCEICLSRVHVDAASDAVVIVKSGSVKMSAVSVAVISAFFRGEADGAVAVAVGVEGPK